LPVGKGQRIASALGMKMRRHATCFREHLLRKTVLFLSTLSAFAVMLVLTSLPVCYGQNVSGMTGEVTDPSGAAVTGATVTLKNAATGLQFTATTDSIGVYRFSEIPPGQGYEAIFTATGSRPSTSRIST
jgi:hypothetical protein